MEGKEEWKGGRRESRRRREGVGRRESRSGGTRLDRREGGGIGEGVCQGSASLPSPALSKHPLETQYPRQEQHRPFPRGK